jgi:hypothetical protein
VRFAHIEYAMPDRARFAAALQAQRLLQRRGPK